MFKNLMNSVLLRQSMYSLPKDTRQQVNSYIQHNGIRSAKRMVETVESARQQGYKTPAELASTAALTKANLKEGSIRMVEADGSDKVLLRYAKDKNGNEYLIRNSENKPYYMGIHDLTNERKYDVKRIVMGENPSSIGKMLHAGRDRFIFNKKKISEETAEAMLDKWSATYSRSLSEATECKTLKDVVEKIKAMMQRH